MYSLGKDPHSWSNFETVVTESLHLSLRIDFTRRILHGYVDHHLVVLADGATEVVLDTKNLAVSEVTLQPSGETLLHTLPRHHPALGLALHVQFTSPRSKGDKLTVRVHYSTTPKSSSIQWFEPHHTTGKKHPYAYTQCQAILARTLVPCMDTPSVKAAYSLDLTVPPELIAVASGSPVGEPKTGGDGWKTFSFKQPIQIPSYLIALAVGALKRATIGPRSSVWTEEALLERAVFEYSKHTEQFVATAEKLFTNLPYVWGTYDLLVLPTAFPYGGMENPQLTFLNSSLLTGDHSLVDVVAHEISHSWSGNLVTNSTWTDFWLNEGFTMYLERVLLGEVVEQSPEKGEQYRLFQIFLGYKELVRVAKDMIDAGEGAWTKLRPDLTGVDPDDAFSIIPYEKGCLFLFYLETLVGGKKPLLAWIGDLYQELKYKTFDSNKMKSSFLDYFSKKGIDQKVLQGIDWDTWLNGEGLPPYNPETALKNSFSDACVQLVNKWVKSDGSDITEADIAHFKPSQVMFCLDELVTSPAMPLSHQLLDQMEAKYHFFSSNVEISHRFIGLALKSKYGKAVEAADHFLPQHGRGRYIKYLFNCLNEHDHAVAVLLWKKHHTHYHSVIVNAFAQKLAQ